MSALSGILSDTYHLVDIVYNIRDSTLCIISSQFLLGNKDIWQVCFRTLILNIVVSSKIDFHQSGTEKGTRERVRSKVTKFGYHYKFLSSF